MKLTNLVSSDSWKLIGESLTGETNLQREDAESARKELQSTLKNYSLIPRYLQFFCWFYAYNMFTSVCETLVRIPIDLTIAIINSLRLFFGSQRMRHTSLYAVILLTGWYIITRDWQLFDLSYLYHSFRGQSTVKLYGAGLALQISQKLLTMAGVSLLSKLHMINRHKQSSFLFLSLSFASIEILIGILYTLLHFFCLYLDFTLYTIVLNSESKNMLMYFFVVNLGKMKAATFKKFESKTFRKSVVYDGKDRYLKISHSIMFILTAWDRIDNSTILQAILVLFYCSLIDHFRHFSSLAMAGKHNEVELIYRDAIQAFQKRGNKVDKCMQWDFTVIPYALYLLKFLSTAIWSHKVTQDDFEWLVAIVYTILFIYSCIVAPLVHKILYTFLKKEVIKSQK